MTSVVGGVVGGDCCAGAAVIFSAWGIGPDNRTSPANPTMSTSTFLRDGPSPMY